MRGRLYLVRWTWKKRAMNDSSLSDWENCHRARTEQCVTVWATIVAAVQGLMNNGALAFRFPNDAPMGSQSAIATPVRSQRC